MKNVVLPAPFGPITARSSPGSTRKSMSRFGREVAEQLAELERLDDAHRAAALAFGAGLQQRVRFLGATGRSERANTARGFLSRCCLSTVERPRGKNTITPTKISPSIRRQAGVFAGEHVLEEHDHGGAGDRAEQRLRRRRRRCRSRTSRCVRCSSDVDGDAAVEHRRAARPRSRSARRRSRTRPDGIAAALKPISMLRCSFSRIAPRHFAELRAREHPREQQHGEQHDRRRTCTIARMSPRSPNGPRFDAGSASCRSMFHGAERQQRVRDRLQPVVAVRPVLRLLDDEVHHLRERERQQREVDPVQPHRQRADEHREHRGYERRAEDREPQVRDAAASRAAAGSRRCSRRRRRTSRGRTKAFPRSRAAS